MSEVMFCAACGVAMLEGASPSRPPQDLEKVKEAKIRFRVVSRGV